MSLRPCDCKCCKEKNEIIEARERRIEQLEADLVEVRAEAKHARIKLSLFMVSGQECRNKENI